MRRVVLSRKRFDFCDSSQSGYIKKYNSLRLGQSVIASELDENSTLQSWTSNLCVKRRSRSWGDYSFNREFSWVGPFLGRI